MPKKTTAATTATAPAPELPEGAALSTHQIWLAGLGAMAQAQAQGNKAFETLVSDGLAFQRQSQQEAQQRWQEATERLTHMAQGLGQSASGRMDKLEHVFEERVARALHRLGMPSLQDLAALQARVSDLEAQLSALQASTSGTPAHSPASAKKPSAKKPSTQADAAPAPSPAPGSASRRAAARASR